MENNIIYSNNVDSDVEIIDNWHIKKLVDLPTQELENEFNIEKFEDIQNSIKTQILYQT